MIFTIQNGRLVSVARQKPERTPRRWNYRRHKRIRTIERELVELFDQALLREEWREIRQQEQVA